VRGAQDKPKVGGKPGAVGGKPVPAKQEEQKQSDADKRPKDNFEQILQQEGAQQDKKRKEPKQKAQQDAAFDPNDFMAAMSRGALMQEEQE
jgi:hypothetical protein